MPRPASPFFQRRQFLRLGFYGSGAGLFGYGSLIERRYPRVDRVDCRIPRQHAALDGLSIALMSDFHHDDFSDDTLMGRAIEACNVLRPDLVMLTGDYISRDLSGMVSLADHLGRLEARLGVFGTLGNHDQWVNSSRVSALLEKAGVSMLVNAASELRAPVTGERFYVAGQESAWGGHAGLAKTLRAVPSGAPVLLGWHEPDPFDTVDDGRVLLQMSGHTHGGQVCAPFYGAIRLPAYGKKYPAGLYERGEKRLYVTRGIGALGVPVRFCCPPEITLLTLRA